ncbi:MAG TPA: hypothetical protein VMW44_00825, partial [Candidatus Bathyarchaeia archaeon]|nr:hypothetical protein [Candidatus Bathyarchaeia archaeon]
MTPHSISCFLSRAWDFFSHRITSEIHQLQDIFDGALLADQATRLRGTVKDQILLLRLDGKREFVGLTFRDGRHSTPGAFVEG